MKKLFTIIVFITSLLLLTGCGDYVIGDAPEFFYNSVEVQTTNGSTTLSSSDFSTDEGDNAKTGFYKSLVFELNNSKIKDIELSGINMMVKYIGPFEKNVRIAIDIKEKHLFGGTTETRLYRKDLQITEDDFINEEFLIEYECSLVPTIKDISSTSTITLTIKIYKLEENVNEGLFLEKDIDFEWGIYDLAFAGSKA